MNVSLKKSLLVSAVAAGLLGMSAAQAGWEANVGAASNYIWRGVTQSNDGAAVSGGLDYSSESGFYAGTWASSLSGGQYELDLYGGYGFEVGGVGLDLGYIAYLYPIGSAELDFSEVYVNAGIGGFSAGLAVQVDEEWSGATDTIYYSAGYDFDLSEDVGASIYAGFYDFDTSDYTHYGLALSKGDFGFAIDGNDQDGDAGDPRVTVSWGTTF